MNLPSTMQQSKQFGRVRVRLDELDDERVIDFAELLKKQQLNSTSADITIGWSH